MNLLGNIITPMQCFILRIKKANKMKIKTVILILIVSASIQQVYAQEKIQCMLKTDTLKVEEYQIKNHTLKTIVDSIIHMMRQEDKVFGVSIPYKKSLVLTKTIDSYKYINVDYFAYNDYSNIDPNQSSFPESKNRIKHMKCIDYNGYIFILEADSVILDKYFEDMGVVKDYVIYVFKTNDAYCIFNFGVTQEINFQMVNDRFTFRRDCFTSNEYFFE